MPSGDSLRDAVTELLDIEDGGMPVLRCTCHGSLLRDCPDRPELFRMTDEPSARAAVRRLDRAVELQAITEDEALIVLWRAERFLPDWRRRLREEGPR